MRAGLVLAVALAGALVNLLAVWVLSSANRASLNVEGSFQHILTDLYGFIGTALAAAVILATGFQRADPIASLLIAALMTRSGVSLVKASGRVFLEAAPEGLDPQEIGRALVAQPGGGGGPRPARVGGHAAASRRCQRTCSWAPTATATPRGGRMEAMLHERFALAHTTLQVDHVASELLEIEPVTRSRPG